MADMGDSYPFTYGNVSTKTMDKVSGTLGEDESCTWQVWSAKMLEDHIAAVEKKKAELAATSLSEKQQHDKLLAHLKENGTRVL